MSEEEFRLRFGHLRTLGTKSPGHLRYELDHTDTDRLPDYTRTAMELGTAVHSLVLGGKPVTSYPGPVRRGKEWEAWKAKNGESTVLSKSDHERAARMAESVLNHKDALAVLNGKKEQTLQFELSGVKCRATPDCYGDDLVELKTTKDAQPDRFGRLALRSGYHAQLAWYAHAIWKTESRTPKRTYIVAVESTAPYPVTVHELTDRAIEEGGRLWRAWFERYRVCLDSHSWPYYTQCIVPLDVPEEFELSFGDEEAA